MRVMKLASDPVPPTMELRYSTTRALVVRWYWRSLRRNRRHLLLWLGLVAFAFLLGAAGSSHAFRGGVIGSVGMILFLAAAPLVMFKRQERVLRVGPEGIQTTIGTRSGEVRWRDVASVARDGDQVIITGRNLNAFIVPANVFSDPAACELAITQWQTWQRDSARLTT